MRQLASRRALFFGLAAVALVTMGHVGSPDVFFDSMAGPYPVRIVVRPPSVVPGQAEITVRTAMPAMPAMPAGGSEGGITAIAVQPVVWNAGPEGVPPAEPARRVRGDSSLWSAQLWLMRPTSYSVRVEVKGAAGTGTVLVPVVAVATRRLPMRRGMAIVLAALGAFLLAGALTAIGAAVRESALPPGVEPDRRHRRRARWVVAGTAVLLALALWGGRVWWRQVDAEFARTIYRPFPVAASVRAAGAGRELTLKIDPPAVGGRGWTPLLPDHGKLLHLFLVRQPGQDAFAHLHPIPEGSDPLAFAATLPPLPAGPYRLYADVTHEDGFSETLTANVNVPPLPRRSRRTPRRARPFRRPPLARPGRLLPDGTRSRGRPRRYLRPGRRPHPDLARAGRSAEGRRGCRPPLRPPRRGRQAGADRALHGDALPCRGRPRRSERR